MRRLVAAALLCAGCGAKTRFPLDASLPDGAVIEAGPLDVVIDDLSGATDPAVRGRVLAARVRRGAGDELQRWWMQASYDPDPFVQRLAARALLDRVGEAEVLPLLTEFANRASGDPYVRLEVVDALLAAGQGAALGGLVGAWRRQPAWRAAPLALIAHRVGDAEAPLIAALAVATAEVRDDPPFVIALGRTGDLEIAGAIGAAIERLEELGPRLGLARAMIAGAGGVEAWRAAVARDGAARDALELVLELPASERMAWAKEVPAGSDPSVRAALAALGGAGGVERALRSRDPWVREIGLRLLDALPAEAVPARLAVALRDPIDLVRVAAADVAVVRRVAGLGEPLAALQVDDHPVVRAAGVAAAWVCGP